MTQLFRKVSGKAGMKPGSVVFVGQKRTENTVINVIDYDKTDWHEHENVQPDDCLKFKNSKTVSWLNVIGIHDTDIIEKFGRNLELQDLILEDIVNTGHRPYFEEDEEFLFLVVKMLSLDETERDLLSEQVSFVIGSNHMISFQEQPGDVFDIVRKRIKNTVPRVRFLGSDYLAYSLIDAIVDNYFIILEKLGEDIEELEDELITSPSSEHLEVIYALKRELLYMRKAVWPLREVVGSLERSESKLLHDYTRPYLRDLYEHIIQVIDSLETYRDTVSGLLDIYLSSVSNRMNQVMKVLTIIATIFIPLSFLAGVYGMNFDTHSSPFNLPELGWRYGYIFFWVVALLIGGGLVWYFKKKDWF